MSTRLELLLVQPPGCARPSGTAAWLHRFPDAAAHHHVRVECEVDWDHLVRRVTSRAMGMVLSGGGARGFGHMGVMRALHEAGVPVDAVGGTSMGALMGIAYALEMEQRDVREIVRQRCSRKALLDRTLPVVSFYSTGKITSFIRSITGDLDIEDAWLPYFCVSSNLTRAGEMIHSRGPMWKAVRASMAAAPIFAPVGRVGGQRVTTT